MKSSPYTSHTHTHESFILKSKIVTSYLIKCIITKNVNQLVTPELVQAPIYLYV